MTSLATPRAHFSGTVEEFLRLSDAHVLGSLSTGSPGDVDKTQQNAWQAELPILRHALSTYPDWAILLEYDVPRIGSRIDAVVLTGRAVVVIEFKVGETLFREADRNQAWDYALDLKNFHKASHDLPIVPVLVATEAAAGTHELPQPAADEVYPPLFCNGEQLRQVLERVDSLVGVKTFDIENWVRAPYHPTPTIVEAARALYSTHSVSAIAASEAGENLTVTSHRVDDIIADARRTRTKSIVFVTGVPGAGKTLVGLNVATTHHDPSNPTHSVFLSGNGPLVKVLSHALAEDEVQRSKASGIPSARVTKGRALQKVKAFIQNVHHFRDEGLNDSGPPPDHVVIFDEAQRAWNLDMTADFMRRKKGRPGFTSSEPEFLLSYLDRHKDWAVVICLVGGGQEINRGEAGISEWLKAIERRFASWQVHISPALTDSEYTAVEAVDRIKTSTTVKEDPSLHLAVSIRSFRAENLSRFVKSVLDLEIAEARRLLQQMDSRYPIVLTRNLDQARDWVRQQARGSERYGLVASSAAERLKPHAVDIRVKVDPVQWFLYDRAHTRSSYYLEDVATEFVVQGLELDWVCVAWDADLRRGRAGWTHHQFKAKRWLNVKKAERQAFLKNAYRVLLTRARQGMVIFVPTGTAKDPTRDPAYYDSTFDYLKSTGIPEI
jgi:hypothetical protein